MVSISPSDVRTKIVGGTPTQQKVLREVLAGLGPTGLEEVEIKKSPRKPLAVGLVVPHDVENVMAEWHTGLLAQGFAERSRELGLPPVAFLAAERGAVDGDDAGPGPAAESSPTLSEAIRTAARARKAAELHGAEVTRLEILKPNGYAFLLELRVEGDQARFLRDGLPRVLAPVEPGNSGFEGDYLLVVDGDGKRVWESMQATSGDGWSEMGGTERWELAGCSPFFRGGPPGRGPPPCPADSSAQPETRTDAGIESIAPTDVTTKIVGATPKQETVLREILAGLGENVLEEVRVSPAGRDWTPIRPSSVVVHIFFAKADKNGRGLWEATLLAEAFERRSRALHLQPVVAYETPGEGTRIEGPGEPDRPKRESVTAEELRSKAVAGANASGADLVELRIVRPQHLAVAITLRTDKPANYLKHHLLTFLDAVPSPSDREYDGLYVLVVDRQGKFVWLSAGTVSDTISGGSGGVRPDLAGCDPVPRLESTTYSPPPCPDDEIGFHVEHVAPSDVTTKIVGGTPKQKALLRKILSGVGPTRLESVEVVTDIEKGWGAPPNAVGFDAKTSKPDDYTHWQAWLVGDAFGALSLELGLPPVAYVGDNGDQSGGLDFSTDTSKAPLTRSEADEALRHVAEIADRYGASTRVRLLKPRRLAFAVDFRTEKPAEFLLGLRRALKPIEDSNEGRHDGLYVKVVDANGRRVLVTGGGYWVRPDLVECSPYGYFGTGMEPPPPPCPAKSADG